jgi:hypothetical protein
MQVWTPSNSFIKRQKEQAAAPKAAAAKKGSSITPAASKALKSARKQYAPGGGFAKGTEAALKRGGKKAIAGGMQSLVSSGLASTSMGAGLAKKYEEEVAAPTRAGVESQRASALAGIDTLSAQMEQGGFESAQSRSLAAGEGAAGRSLQERLAAMSSISSRPRAQMSTFASRSSAPSTPTAATSRTQHVSGSGMGSFLENLRSSDIMSAPNWEF